MITDRLRRLLPALWAGVLLCTALLATPALFALLAQADAGRVAGRLLGQEAWLSLALGLLLLGLERARARALAEAGQGSVLSAEMLWLLGALFCTVAGHFGLQPMLAEARAGQGRWGFGQLHAASALLFGLKTLLVLMLAWRASAPVQLSPRPSS